MDSRAFALVGLRLRKTLRASYAPLQMSDVNNKHPPPPQQAVFVRLFVRMLPSSDGGKPLKKHADQQHRDAIHAISTVENIGTSCLKNNKDHSATTRTE
jgi:hypothetical protein